METQGGKEHLPFSYLDAIICIYCSTIFQLNLDRDSLFELNLRLSFLLEERGLGLVGLKWLISCLEMVFKE